MVNLCAIKGTKKEASEAISLALIAISLCMKLHPIGTGVSGDEDSRAKSH